MSRSDTEVLAASLSEWLSRVVFTDVAAVIVTEAITRSVMAWARQQGWRPRREMPVDAQLPDHEGRFQGYLDLLCERPDGPPVAIEIDRVDKPRSMAKLNAVVGAGAVGLWLRWGESCSSNPSPTIPLVWLEVHYRFDQENNMRLYTRRASWTVAPFNADADGEGSTRPQATLKPRQCTATTKKGHPCINGPRKSGLCHLHDPEVQCGAIIFGRRCTVATGGGRCQTHRTTRDSPEPEAALFPLHYH